MAQNIDVIHLWNWALAAKTILVSDDRPILVSIFLINRGCFENIILIMVDKDSLVSTTKVGQQDTWSAIGGIKFCSWYYTLC